MTRFLQLHLLTAYSAANLNRDDTGRPKTLKYGGAERLRISSQSLKRAFRESDVFAGLLPDALGKRSTHFMQALVDALVARGLDAETAVLRAETVIEHDKLGKVRDKGKGAARTEQLVHLGPEELASLEALADRLAETELSDEKGILVLKHKPRAADIAMFGRMLADNPGYNVEAAVQVAHAFTTHRVNVEDDYYTAVDDIKSEDSDADRGAGFIGVQYFGAGLFYLYICVNCDLLLSNLAEDASLAADTIEALIRSSATVSPGGKQNAFASRAKALFVSQEIGTDTPRSLSAAFQNAVGQQGENDYRQASINRLKELQGGFARAYCETFDTLDLDVHTADGAKLDDLVARARAIFRDGAQ